MDNIAPRKYCRSCGTRLNFCSECKKWYAPSRADQIYCSDACWMRHARGKNMVTDKAGKKYHLLGEIKDKGRALVAVKFYDKSKRIWFHELRPKEDFE